MILEYPEFTTIFAENGFELSEEQYRRFYKYAELLIEWNEKINLTGITDPRGISIKHFLDSVLPFGFISIPDGAKLIDVGTGAGFPGIPVKIMREDIKLTLLDSLNKRVNFLTAVCENTDINAECLHGRAEEFGKKPQYRECFDIASARAVAAMPVLAEYCLPFVKVGGVFAALKGKSENYRDSESALKILGGEIAEVREYKLTDGDGRILICVKKVRETPEKYPRNSSQISKKPL